MLDSTYVLPLLSKGETVVTSLRCALTAGHYVALLIGTNKDATAVAVTIIAEK